MSHEQRVVRPAFRLIDLRSACRPFTPKSSQADPTLDNLLPSLLPSWPLSEAGDAIPDNLINSWRGDFCKGKQKAYFDFPSKGNKCEVDPNLSPDRYPMPTKACPGYT